MSDWQTMDTAPKDGRWILVHGLDCDGRGAYWPEIGLARYDAKIPGGGWETRNVAYPANWQPLPAPPNNDGCRRRLAKGQHWAFCGETDMGQSLPALCTECGGPFKLEAAP